MTSAVGRPKTIGFKNFSEEQRRLYMRETSRKYRERRHPKKKAQIDFDDKRRCKKCERVLERTPDNFYRSKGCRHGLNTICKKCCNKSSKTYLLRDRFACTPEEYEAVLKDAACAICGGTQRLVLDHCHDKNHVRGVLCALCNAGLGMFKDDSSALRRAADYLEMKPLEGPQA